MDRSCPSREHPTDVSVSPYSDARLSIPEGVLTTQWCQSLISGQFLYFKLYFPYAKFSKKIFLCHFENV